jgi:hypothetical protein
MQAFCVQTDCEQLYERASGRRWQAAGANPAAKSEIFDDLEEGLTYSLPGERRMNDALRDSKLGRERNRKKANMAQPDQTQAKPFHRVAEVGILVPLFWL